MKQTRSIEFDSNLSKIMQKIVSILMVVTILVFFYGLFASYTSLHSDKHIKVELVDMSTEYVPSKYSYSSGTRYIYFEFEVESKKIKVDSVDLTLYIHDKDGNELGSLTASLGSDYDRMELGKGEKETITVSWDDEYLYWGDEDMFEFLYNADFSDLVFTYEITRIEFTDGYTYTN